ncbi:HD domain-containing protein [Nitrosophilus alvini]|uniref:[protein-PII] uridylyltransferase family protein n=1 Tax=Nitrosophilus alvini TaxID=2714855 RepID=UPI00190D2B58|nr:HD domain-containing protein [Nitrosophilus alvini]
MTLKENIEDLLDKNATELEISKAIRKYIKNYFGSLDELFKETQGKDFLVRHTRHVDNIINTIYRVAVRKMFGIYTPMSNSIPITLVALGSYGREQLCVYSDIDLMIVYDECEGYNTNALIEKILYIAWDAGLKLGHRVHSLKELSNAAMEDDTIKTALIESRYICGSKFLWIKIENELGKIRSKNRKKFVFEKIEEAKKRRAKYPISMEPNIKEGTGGLRDANLLYWIANVLYGAKTLKDLSGKLFTDEEYREFRIALEWLFRVRAAIHLAAGKKEDRLLLEYIPEVSKRLLIRYKSDSKIQQVLVSKTLDALHTIDNFTQIFVKKMVKVFLYNPKNLSKLRKSRITKNIFFCDNTLYASFNSKESRISELIDILLKIENIKKIDPSFIYYAKNTIYSRSSKNIKNRIKKLFYKNKIYEILTLFYNTKLLPLLIPPIKKIIHLPQFDGYHEYPVDVHSLLTIYYLERVKDPFLKDLMKNLSKDELAILKLSAFLHDAGKGRKQDHSEVGAKLIRMFAKKIGFSEDIAEIGATLVRYHTLMSNTAYREDIYNEKTVFSFTAKLKTPKILDMLYLLTYADINAVGKNRYNSYNAELMKELYLAAKESFAKKEILDETAKRIKKEEALKRNSNFQSLPKTLQKKILSIESNLFFIKHKTNEIIEIAKKAAETEDFKYEINNNNFLSIEIIRKVPLNLGYLLGKLSSFDVASMEVFKLFDNIKYFKIDFLEKADIGNIGYIEQIVANSFDMEKKIKLKKPDIKREEIKIDCEHSKTYATMFLNVKNQKGLLAYIASLFDKFGIDIATAKVHTVKKRAKDLFLIEKNGNFCNNRESILKLLTEGSG